MIKNQKIKDDFFPIRLYTSVYFGFINEYLRAKTVLKELRDFKGFTEDLLKSWVCCLHLALSRNINVKNDTIVYRGISKYRFPLDIGIGSNFTLDNFFQLQLKKIFQKNG